MYRRNLRQGVANAVSHGVAAHRSCMATRHRRLARALLYAPSMSATFRLVPAFTALALLAGAAPARAQKAPATAAPDYDQELSALVGIQGGLTADVAAARAAKVSP